MYRTIEELAQDVGISKRTAWRYLKDGRIEKRQSRDGQVVFVLSDSVSDRVPGDTVTNGTDVTPIKVNKAQSVDKRILSGLALNPNPSQQLMSEREDTERSELRLIRLRNEKESKELQRTLMAEERAKEIIEQIKGETLPFEMCRIIPGSIILEIYRRIEMVLKKLDVVNIPYRELILVADEVLTTSLNDPQIEPLVRDSLYRFNTEMVRRIVRQQVTQGFRLLYRQQQKPGVSFRMWINSLVRDRTFEEQSKVLELIDFDFGNSELVN